MKTVKKAGIGIFLLVFSFIVLFPLFDMVIMATYPSEELFGSLKLAPGRYFSITLILLCTIDFGNIC